MDDRTAPKNLSAIDENVAFHGGSKLRRRFPTVEYLRRHARHHVPHFVFEYMDGGAGEDRGIADNWAALDAIDIVPRYGVMPKLPPVEVELFGRTYAAPIGIPPMGGPGLCWPGADQHMARAAQRKRVPYCLGMVGGMTVEEAGTLAPDVLWFQLYRMAQNDHALGFDMVRRAEAAGAHVLALTVDTPVRTQRTREVAAGLGGPFRPGPRMMFDMVTSPGWFMALMQNGRPKFSNLRKYVGENASTNETIAFTRNALGGAFTWDEVARYRDFWRGPLALKGILHPADAERAVALGIDGIWVSNHGGRQVEALPPSIDVLPAIAQQVGRRATILFDSGVRSGLDVVRAVALGAHAAFAGKAFLWGLGALGEAGPGHVIDLIMDEARAVFGQIGAHTPAEARTMFVRHPGALAFAPGATGEAE